MISKAKLSDAKGIKKLVDDHARRNEMLGRPLSVIYENIRSFIVERSGKKIVGCCALYIVWEDLAEIKSLAVEPRNQRKGVGAKLTKAALADAKKLGLKRVFTLTNKPDFFIKQGFKKIGKNKLPRKIWGECIRCSKYDCCDEDALVYEL